MPFSGVDNGLLLRRDSDAASAFCALQSCSNAYTPLERPPRDRAGIADLNRAWVQRLEDRNELQTRAHRIRSATSPAVSLNHLDPSVRIGHATCHDRQELLVNCGADGAFSDRRKHDSLSPISDSTNMRDGSRGPRAKTLLERTGVAIAKQVLNGDQLLSDENSHARHTGDTAA